MYLDNTGKLDSDAKSILATNKKSGILIMMDSNSTSRMWYDKLTNGRAKN
jgi:hypothetical protein